MAVKNSLFDLVLDSRSISSSIACTGSISFNTLRRIQIFYNSSLATSSSSRRVFERRMSMAG